MRLRPGSGREKERSGDPLLHPARPSPDAWWPRRALEARCTASPILSLIRRPHDAPDAGCTCGIYAARSLESMERPRPAWPPPPVVGTASLWGRIVEHKLGWRAAFAYPSRLRLVCAMCAWFEPGPGKPVTVHTLLRRVGGSGSNCPVCPMPNWCDSVEAHRPHPGDQE